MRSRFRWLVLALALAVLGCHSGRPASTAGASDRIAPGERCDPKGPLGQILDGNLKPVDLQDEFAVDAVTGRPVLVCVQISEELSGRVLDEPTGGPLVGASITVNSWQSPTPTNGLHEPRSMIYSQQVLTDEHGAWRLPSVSLWMGGFLAADGIPFVKTSQCIQAAGHAPAVFDPWKRIDWSVNPNLSNVRLALIGKVPTGLSSACVFHK